MRRRLRHLTALFAIAFFFVPLLLLAGGVRATEFENRRLAERPKLSEGWAAFDSATSYLVDHLPLREQAVRANSWKSLNVFRTTPKYGRPTNAMAEDQALPFAGGEAAGTDQPAAPDTAAQVLRGVDDWLYLQGDVDRACTPFMPPADAVARWVELGEIVQRSGRRVIVVVAPDKSTIYPEHLPSPFTNEDCMRDGRERLWTALESSTSPLLLPLREPVLAAKSEFDRPIYFRTDSHWNSAGAAVLVREIVAKLGASPLPASAISEAGTVEHVGDLGNLLGTPMDETALQVTIESGSTRHLPGRVAFIHDSFGVGPLEPLRAQSGTFATAVWANDPPAKIVSTIRGADTVIIETVEREVTYRGAAVLTDAFLAQLERQLARP